MGPREPCNPNAESMIEKIIFFNSIRDTKLKLIKRIFNLSNVVGLGDQRNFQNPALRTLEVNAPKDCV